MEGEEAINIGSRGCRGRVPEGSEGAARAVRLDRGGKEWRLELVGIQGGGAGRKFGPFLFTPLNFEFSNRPENFAETWLCRSRECLFNLHGEYAGPGQAHAQVSSPVLKLACAAH